MRAMRVGVLKSLAASLHATRFVSSLRVTAKIRSASAAPACSRMRGCAALPAIVRKSRRSCRSFKRASSLSTTVMSFASEHSASATELPTWPAPRMMIFNSQASATGCAILVLFSRAVKRSEAPDRYGIIVGMRRAVSRVTRIYAPGVLAPGASLSLREAAAHHLSRVLRAQVGDRVIVFNDGVEFPAAIARIDKHGVTVRLEGGAPVDRENPLACELAQAISSGERMDMTLQKAAELGV